MRVSENENFDLGVRGIVAKRNLVRRANLAAADTCFAMRLQRDHGLAFRTASIDRDAEQHD